MPCQSYDEVPEHWMLVLRLEQYIKSVPVQMDFESKFDDNGGLSKAQSQLLTLIEAHSQTGDGVHVNWLSDQLQRNIQSDLTHLISKFSCTVGNDIFSLILCNMTILFFRCHLKA